MSAVVVLSAYAEALEEQQKRVAFANRLPAKLRLHPLGLHTYREACWAIDSRQDQTDLVVVTSGYHAERAFLSFVQALLDRGLEHVVRVRVVAADNSPTTNAERERIVRYRRKGHCATQAEADEYVAHWMLA